MKEKILNTKNSKGITLVALIITIVVLLILAIVSIGAVQDSGIIAHAQNAAGGYNEAKTNETVTLAGYETKIEEYVPEDISKKDEETKYYYTEEYAVEGDLYKAIYAIKDIDENKKECSIYLELSPDTWVYQTAPMWFYEKNYEVETMVEWLKVEAGKTVFLGYKKEWNEEEDPELLLVLKDNKIYFMDLECNFDSIEFNEDIKNIIESASEL